MRHNELLHWDSLVPATIRNQKLSVVFDGAYSVRDYNCFTGAVQCLHASKPSISTGVDLLQVGAMLNMMVLTAYGVSNCFSSVCRPGYRLLDNTY